jgi:hypothetical protein
VKVRNFLFAFVLLLRAVPALAASEEATEALYVAAPERGVVLFDIYWARAWKCGRFENAQLKSLVFERAPLKPGAEPGSVALSLANPSGLTAPQRFVPHAFLVDAGEYHLTSFEVGFARTASNIGSVKIGRSSLVSDGRSKAGSFKVGSGESVYIGNFAVDCYSDPIPWRFYTEEKDFPEHLAQYRSKYPFLKLSPVLYRLFETSVLGKSPDSK